MNAVELIWPTMIAVCLVFAGVHAYVWLRVRHSSHGSFALLCVAIASVALMELMMMHATSTQAYLLLLRGFYVAIQAGFVALVYFVWIYLNAGRRWLGWLAIMMRGVVTVGGLIMPNTLHFRELHAMEPMNFLGATVVVPIGTQSPWLTLGLMSNLALVIFLFDATVTLWRQRYGRQAIVLGSALLMLVISGMTIATAVGFGSVKMPLHVTLSFIAIIAIMGAQMSQDLVRTARLSLELAEAENRLLHSRQRLSLAAEAAKVGFWTFDPSTMRFHGSPWAMRLFGMEDNHVAHFDELLGAMHPDDRDHVRRALSDALSSPQLISVEYRTVHKDGGTRWFLSAGGGSFAGSGDAQRLTGVTFDITDRKLAEQTAQQQREKAEHLSRVVTVSGLSGVLANELRQPLARILSSARQALATLNHRSGNLQPLGPLVADMVAMNDGASQVIAKLRMLLRRSEPQREDLPLATLVEGMLDFLQSDLMHRGVEVATRLDHSLPAIRADRVRMEQVIINLIISACDAMADRPRMQRQLSVSVRAAEKMAELRVAYGHRGALMPPGQMLDAASAARSVISDAGLPICRAIIESQGGRLWIDANDESRSGFRVELPFAECDN